MDAFLEHTRQRLEWAEADDITTELIAQVGRVHAVLSDERVSPHIAGLVAESQRDPAVAERFHANVVLPYREVTVRGLERAQASDQLRGDIDIALLADSLFAPMWFRLLLRAAPLDEFDPETHVRQLLDGAGA